VPSVIFHASLGILGKIFFLPVIISKTFFALEEGSEMPKRNEDSVTCVTNLSDIVSCRERQQ
jgi:hypothetical protein